MALVGSRVLVAGECSGAEVLHSEVGLSFWGGVDAETGVVVEKNHPLEGERLTGKVVCLPSGRGSCTASQVVLELVLNGRGPAGLILKEVDELLALGFVVAEEIFKISGTPVVVVENDDAWQAVTTANQVTISSSGKILLNGSRFEYEESSIEKEEVFLSESDKGVLAGKEGKARSAALRIIARVASMIHAPELIHVSRAHIDAVTYIGPASLRFVEALLELGGPGFKVPTTTNSSSVDLKRWRGMGVPIHIGEPAEKLAMGYLQLGAEPSFTCAPYLLDSPPSRGEQLGWSESNAVTFANSILGASTLKNADFLDACIALTGRAPLAGPHLLRNRVPQHILDIDLQSFSAHADNEDLLWPVAGYAAGLAASTTIPLIHGFLESQNASKDDLKHFSAAFATTSKAPLFHIAGHTPQDTYTENDLEDLPRTRLTCRDLDSALQALGGFFSTPDSLPSEDTSVDLVALGNPHASVLELEKLYSILQNQPETQLQAKLIITLGRGVLYRATEIGLTSSLLKYNGVEFVQDTCWCMLNAPVIPQQASIVTNSAKYAHYAPGLVRPRRIQLSSLAGCVDAAVTGVAPRRVPPWWLRTQRRSFSSLACKALLLRRRPH